MGEQGDAFKPELIDNDLDLDKIKKVRDTWAFYRDRAPTPTTSWWPGRGGGDDDEDPQSPAAPWSARRATADYDVLIDGETIAALLRTTAGRHAAQGVTAGKTIDARAST